MNSLSKFQKMNEKIYENFVSSVILKKIFDCGNCDSILSSFGSGRQAWCAGIVINSVHRDFLLSTSRIWDNHYRSASIPNAIRALKCNDLQRQIVSLHKRNTARRRRDSEIIPGKNIDAIDLRKRLNQEIPRLLNEASDKIIAEINSTIELGLSNDAKHLNSLLKSFRDKYLAHSDVGFEEHDPQKIITFGQLENIFKITEDVSERLHYIAFDSGFDVGLLREQTTEAATRFWIGRGAVSDTER